VYCSTSSCISQCLAFTVYLQERDILTWSHSQDEPGNATFYHRHSQDQSTDWEHDILTHCITVEQEHTVGVSILLYTHVAWVHPIEILAWVLER